MRSFSLLLGCVALVATSMIEPHSCYSVQRKTGWPPNKSALWLLPFLPPDSDSGSRFNKENLETSLEILDAMEKKDYEDAISGWQLPDENDGQLREKKPLVGLFPRKKFQRYPQWRTLPKFQERHYRRPTGAPLRWG